MVITTYTARGFYKQQSTIPCASGNERERVYVKDERGEMKPKDREQYRGRKILGGSSLVSILREPSTCLGLFG